jgi:hypothetical protein
MRRWAALCLLVTALAIPAASPAASTAKPLGPQTRLLNIWLDLQLLPLMAHGSTATRDLAAALQRVARQLGQPAPMIRHGRKPADTHRYPVRAVLIKPDTPKDTLVMFARSATGEIWKLVDDGHLRVFKVHAGKASPLTI